MSASAIDELRAAFEEPFWALGRDAARDRGTVVMSWPSVPVELVRAAGFSPVFARGRSTPTPAADRVLEPDLFPNRLRQLVEAALTDRLADVAAIVLPRTSDPDYKCFLYLRELVRRGIAAALPPIVLFDLLQSDGADVRAYNADATRATCSTRLASLAGRQHRADDLRAADRERQCARALRPDACTHCAAIAPRIAGADALPLLGAFWQLEPERYAALANATADTLARRAPLERPRVLLAGAPVDGQPLHAAIEADGAVVVAELSPFGGCGASADVAHRGRPVRCARRQLSVASRSARALPVNALLHKLDGLLGAVDAVVVSLPPDDASFGWDYPRAARAARSRARFRTPCSAAIPRSARRPRIEHASARCSVAPPTRPEARRG